MEILLLSIVAWHGLRSLYFLAHIMKGAKVTFETRDHAVGLVVALAWVAVTFWAWRFWA